MMEFVVTRTSDFGGSLEPPCEGAVCVADEGERTWHLVLDSLAALMAFVGKYGEVVVFPLKDGLGRIEIYDTYRE